MNRRDFLHTGTAAAALALPGFALAPDNVYRNEIGIQLYTLRKQLKADTPGTIKAVAEAGYKQVEAYGFPDAGPMIQAAKDNGLEVRSAHFAWEAVTNPEKDGVPAFADILQKAKDTGLTHLVIPYIHAHNRKTLDDYKRLAERCNAGAELAKSAGIQLAYHNHAFEFEPKEGGKNGYDIFVAEFVPAMKFEVDVFWVKVGGADPVALIRKLKGRVSQLHLKDLKTGSTVPNFGRVPNDAFDELGDGMIPMEPVIEVAAEAGVAICHVEQDQSPDPIASVVKSIKFLKTL
jgi:sugar phosphate isomerase/epimerase